MTKNPIPAWATTPGATVLLEPGGYGRERRFLPAVITRVTKASVFTKVGDGRERRWVPSTWMNDENRMMEYGQSNAWHPGAYIWNPECDAIKNAVAKAAARKVETDIAKAAQELADGITKADGPGGDYEERITTLLMAIDRYQKWFPVVIEE